MSRDAKRPARKARKSKCDGAEPSCLRALLRDCGDVAARRLPEGGYVQVPWGLLRAKFLTPGDKIVLSIYLDRFRRGVTACMGPAAIGADAGLSSKSVQLAVHHLRQLGLLVATDAGPGKDRIYSLGRILPGKNLPGVEDGRPGREESSPKPGKTLPGPNKRRAKELGASGDKGGGVGPDFNRTPAPPLGYSTRDREFGVSVAMALSGGDPALAKRLESVVTRHCSERLSGANGDREGIEESLMLGARRADKDLGAEANSKMRLARFLEVTR